MREIRTSGSEGGGVETNRRSLPLSVTTGISNAVKPGDDSQFEALICRCVLTHV